MGTRADAGADGREAELGHEKCRQAPSVRFGPPSLSCQYVAITMQQVRCTIRRSLAGNTAAAAAASVQRPVLSDENAKVSFEGSFRRLK